MLFLFFFLFKLVLRAESKQADGIPRRALSKSLSTVRRTSSAMGPQGAASHCAFFPQSCSHHTGVLKGLSKEARSLRLVPTTCHGSTTDRKGLCIPKPYIWRCPRCDPGWEAWPSRLGLVISSSGFCKIKPGSWGSTGDLARQYQH